MSGEKVIESLNNAWSALNAKYQNSPSEKMRCAANLVGKICTEVISEYNKYKSEDGKQITIEEWLAWLQADID